MKSFLILLLASLSFSLLSTPLFAQDEEIIEEAEFAPPPPPPPGTFVTEEDDEAEEVEEEAATPSNRPRFGGGSPRRNTPPSGSGSPNPSFNAIKDRKPLPFSEAEPEDMTNENFPDLIESFDYPNADIADVVKAISELTGKNFIIDPNIRGKITILAPTQITKAEAYKAFLSALAMNGYTVVPYGSFLKIKAINEAKRDSISTYSGSYSPDTDQLITRIIHLKHISADEVNRSLRILVSAKGEMAPYPPTNSLIVTDFGANIQRIMTILNQLDVQGFEEQMAVMPIKNAKAKDIAELIEQIINKDSSSGSKSSRRGSFSSGIPRFGGNNKSQNSSAFSMVIPDDRTNAIIVVGNKSGIKKIRNLLNKLDYPLNAEDAGGVYVYYMKHAEAKEVADILNGVAKDSKEASQPKGTSANDIPRSSFARRDEVGNSSAETFFGGDIKITADESINSLIITANRQDYEAVKTLLAKIDIPRNQVNVEVIIMEVAAGGSKSWGVSTYKFEDLGSEDANGIARVGFNGLGQDVTNVFTKNLSSDGFVLGFGSGKDVSIKLGSETVTIPSLISFINLIESVTDVNIMSTPNITVLDNKEAEIEVGETIPVAAAGQQNATGTSTSITREPATLKLKIKPRISPGSKAVRLDITQTIKQLAPTQVQAKNLSDNAVTTSERNVKTEIVVNNKDTAIIGGLMTDSEQVTERKVPILGDIPILGWLFKSRSKKVQKRNLVMFITPNIIRSSEDIRGLKEEKLNERIDFIKRNMGGRDPFGATADKISTNTSNTESNGDLESQEELSDESNETIED